MTKSPCIGCEFELADKNNPTCRECDKRVEYVASDEEEMNIEHRIRQSPLADRIKKMEIKETAGVRIDASLPIIPVKISVGQKREYHKTGDKKKQKRNAMKNKLLDLNDYMFSQLERLSDVKLKGDKLTEEIQRSHAVTSVAGQIISNAGLALKARVAANDLLLKNMPKMLGVGDYEEKE